jgi:hypothetical protein
VTCVDVDEKVKAMGQPPPVESLIDSASLAAPSALDPRMTTDYAEAVRGLTLSSSAWGRPKRRE